MVKHSPPEISGADLLALHLHTQALNEALLRTAAATGGIRLLADGIKDDLPAGIWTAEVRYDADGPAIPFVMIAPAGLARRMYGMPFEEADASSWTAAAEGVVAASAALVGQPLAVQIAEDKMVMCVNGLRILEPGAVSYAPIRPVRKSPLAYRLC